MTEIIKTPRTDAHQVEWPENSHRWAAFARELERELVQTASDRDFSLRKQVTQATEIERLSGDARVERSREALERIAAFGPRPYNNLTHGPKLRCHCCLHWWGGDAPEHHDRDCAYVIARDALAQGQPSEERDPLDVRCKHGQPIPLRCVKCEAMLADGEIPAHLASPPGERSPVVWLITYDNMKSREAFVTERDARRLYADLCENGWLDVKLHPLYADLQPHPGSASPVARPTNPTLDRREP